MESRQRPDDAGSTDSLFCESLGAWVSESAEVMLVEDDAAMSQAIGRMLVASGYHVTAFPSAESLLAADVPKEGCLVLDVHLPGISGLELYEQLRAGGGAPPCVFITGQDDPATRERALASGAIAYLTKPVPGKYLVDAVARALATPKPS